MLTRETIPAIDKTLSHIAVVEVMEKVRELLHFTNAIDLVYDNSDFQNNKYLLKYKKDKEIMASKIDVMYEEKASEDSLYFKPQFNNNKPFIKDRDLVVKPVYIQHDIVMNFKIISKSKTDINLIADRLYRIAMEGFNINHHFRYTYYLNKTISYLLLFVYKYRQNYNLLTNEFIEFLQEVSSPALKLTYDNSGRPTNVTYEETLTNITGLFKDIKEPKAEFDKRTGYYTIDFSYELEYSKLTYVDIFYNYIIANQFLPKALIPEDKSIYKVTDTSMLSDMSKLKISEPLYTRVISSILNNSYIKIPENDVDSKLVKQRCINTIISGLTLISPDDPRSLIDLNNLGDIALTDEVIEFIKSEGQAVVNEGESVIQIKLYKDNDITGIPLTIDENLVVSAEEDLDLNYIYRVGIGLITDVFYLKYPAYERYKAFREDIMKTFLLSNRVNADYQNGHLVILNNFFVYDIYSEAIFTDGPWMKTKITSAVIAFLKDK